MKPTPILIIGDNPLAPGGLARSGKDLASLAATMPEFRVGYLARGVGNSRRFPWAMYPHDPSDWGQATIQAVWGDFAGSEHGIILTTDDPSRRHWMISGLGCDSLTSYWLQHRPFSLWGYFPIDSTGPSGTGLGQANAQTVLGYNRVLCASEWGKNVVDCHRRDGDWLPHGISREFTRDSDARDKLGWPQDGIAVGCVMANQSRKDWPTAFAAAARLKSEFGLRFRLWAHTNKVLHYWNLYSLILDYGLQGFVEITTDLTDSQLALRYSACDVTMLPSAGEGFGFPIAESLACGTAAVVTDYAAGQEIVGAADRVRPVAFRVDTEHNVLRAVLDGAGFANHCLTAISRRLSDPVGESERLAETVDHLRWPNLKWLWERWLRTGLREMTA